MKRFHIVTEADARVLEYGSTIVLAAGGHVTPLAQDTLRARRVTVVADVADVDLAALAPVAAIRTVAVAGDHTSLALKAALVQHLRGRGLAAHDLGTTTTEPVDYPDTAAAAARAGGARGSRRRRSSSTAPASGRASPPTRLPACAAAMCTNETLARYARQHNGANVLALGSTLVSAAEAAGDRRRLRRHADARGALHPPARQDSRPRGAPAHADGARPISSG